MAYDDDIIDVHADIEEDTAVMEDNVREAESLDAGDVALSEEGDSPIDRAHDVQRQVLEALDRGDTLHAETMASNNAPEDDDPDAYTDSMEDMQRLYEHATTALYAGASSSILSTTIIIMNMCVLFRVSNKFTDELLQYLATDLLPRGNRMPCNHYEARKMIRKLGLEYKTSMHVQMDAFCTKRSTLISVLAQNVQSDGGWRDPTQCQQE